MVIHILKKNNELSKSNIKFITIQNKSVSSCVFGSIHHLFVYLRMQMSTSKQQA